MLLPDQTYEGAAVAAPPPSPIPPPPLPLPLALPPPLRALLSARLLREDFFCAYRPRRHRDHRKSVKCAFKIISSISRECVAAVAVAGAGTGAGAGAETTRRRRSRAHRAAAPGSAGAGVVAWRSGGDSSAVNKSAALSRAPLNWRYLRTRTPAALCRRLTLAIAAIRAYAIACLIVLQLLLMNLVPNAIFHVVKR
ncbi:hypothetical protein ACJJTC_001601 [Scirpophaga incertulas]